MLSKTLPASTQPDEPPDVTPCHFGPAASVCSFCADLAGEPTDTAALQAVTQFDAVFVEVMGTCISCGAEYGQAHFSWCKFVTFDGVA